MTSIAIVIPFFQRSSGILARALNSVFNQYLPKDYQIRIIIVDDDSPISLRNELAMISPPDGFSITALQRANGGPGAARNTALDCLDKNATQFVAFLDSDDVWKPRHIIDGLLALDNDADFYFCDHVRWNQTGTWFTDSKPFQLWLANKYTMFFPVANKSDIYQFAPDCALPAFLMDYLAQTSTVIYRFQSFPCLRFDAALRHAGEDLMFWLDLANRARKVRFSLHANVTTGEGINMYAASLDWDHPDASRRLAYDVLVRASAINRFGKSPAAKSAVQPSYWRFQKEFMWVSVRSLMRRRTFDLSLIRRLIRERKMLAVTLPLALLAAAVRRPA